MQFISTRSHLVGILIGAIASACYGTNPLFMVPLHREGLSPAAILFLRYAIALTVFVPVMSGLHKSFRLNRHTVFPVLLLGVLFAVSSETLFDSYLYIDVGIASTLLFVYPIFVALSMTCFFHEKLTRSTGVSLALACIGIALLSRSSNGAAIQAKGFWLVMLAAAAYAAYMIGVNRPRILSVDGLTIAFYALALGTVFYGLQTLLTGEMAFPKDTFGWMNVLGIACVPTVLAILGTTLSIRLIGPTPAAILGALEPATGVFIGLFVFDEHLTLRLISGIALILLSVILVTRSRAAQPSSSR